MLLQTVLFLIGLLLLYLGAKYLVESSSILARKTGIRTTIIGLTIIAFGTSTPELFISVVSALKGVQSIAMGNIIGSNIANIGLILGLSATIRPLKIELNILRKELPIMLFVSVLLFLMALDLKISSFEGVILFIGIIIFTLYLIYSSKDKDMDIKIKEENKKLKNIFFILIGLLMLILGSNLLVKSAIFIASSIGISEFIIGLTIVAIGTSLPELATSLVATYKKEQNICIGNIIGSNIFNMLMIIGIISIITPLTISLINLKIDFVVMLIFSFALIPLFRVGFVLSRIEGTMLVIFYLVYITLSFIN